MATVCSNDNVDYRLLGLMSDLVICSSCLRQGRVTPIPQIVSHRHTLRSQCAGCATPRRRSLRRVLRHLTHA